MAAGGDAEVPVEDVPQPPAILHDDRIVVAQLRFQLLVLLVGHLQRPVLGGGVAGGQKHQRKGKDGYQQNYRQGQSQSGQKVFFMFSSYRRERQLRGRPAPRNCTLSGGVSR